MRLAARNHGHVRGGFNLARELTTALVVVGWLFMAFQLMELTMRGTIASAGPGMGFFDQMKAWFLPQDFSLAMLYSICTTQSLVWSGADFVKALGMWLAMILAMMVPTLAAQFQNMDLPRLKLSPLLGFVGGYLFVWLGFCFAMVALHGGCAQTWCSAITWYLPMPGSTVCCWSWRAYISCRNPNVII